MAGLSRYIVILIIVYFIQFTGALTLMNLLEAGNWWVFWAYQGLCIFALVSLSVGFFLLFFRQKDSSVETQKVLSDEIRDLLTKSINGTKNISTAVAQIETLYRDSIEAFERLNKGLKSFAGKMGSIIPEEIEESLGNLKNKAEDVASASVHLKTELEKFQKSFDRLKDFSPRPLYPDDTKVKFQGIRLALEDSLEQFSRQLSELNEKTRQLNSTFGDAVYSIKEGFQRDIDTVEETLVDIDTLMDDHIENMTDLQKIQKTMDELLTHLQKVTAKARILSINAQVATVEHTDEERSFGILAEEILNLSQEATEATHQISKSIHNLAGKTEVLMDSSRAIKNYLKTMKKNLQDFGSRVDELNNVIDESLKKLQDLMDQTLNINLTENIEKISLEIEETGKNLQDAMKYQTEQTGQLQMLLNEFLTSQKTLTALLDRTAGYYEKVKMLVMTVDDLEKQMEKIKTTHAERCRNASVRIEETAVVSEQLKILNEHLQTLDKETRQVLSLIERIAGE